MVWKDSEFDRRMLHVIKDAKHFFDKVVYGAEMPRDILYAWNFLHGKQLPKSIPDDIHGQVAALCVNYYNHIHEVAFDDPDSFYIRNVRPFKSIELEPKQLYTYVAFCCMMINKYHSDRAVRDPNYVNYPCYEITDLLGIFMLFYEDEDLSFSE